MDLLPSPTGKSLLGHAPFVCGDRRWDGGRFFHYACRLGRLESVPLHLRKCNCSVPFDEQLPPADPSAKEALYQNWFFFGLLAEFYGLNDDRDESDHKRTPADIPDRVQTLESLFDAFTESEGKDKHIIGAKLLTSHEDDKLLAALRKSWGDPTWIATHAGYLYECLEFMRFIVGSFFTRQSKFEPTVLVSINALGELLDELLVAVTGSEMINTHQLPGLGGWGGDYPEAGGDVEETKIKNGWCKSEIARVRQQFRGLGTKHFISHLEKRTSSADHASCSARRCNHSQTDPKTYALSHIEGCNRNCDIIGADEVEVKRIL